MRLLAVSTSSEKEVETQKRSFLARVFGYSTDADDTDTIRSGFSGTYSEDTSDCDSSACDDDSSFDDFDRDLRARHTEACKYMRTGDFQNALGAFKDILTTLVDAYGDEHHRVGAALHNVGIANLRAGKLDDAMTSLEKAVRMRKRTLGESHPKVADSLVELGIIHLSLKEYDNALTIFEEALQMREREARDTLYIIDSKENRLKIAKVLNNIGCVNFEREEFREALDAFNNAVKLQRAVLTTETRGFSVSTPSSKPSYLTMACTFCNKGYVELELSQYAQAAETFEESLKLQRKLLSDENPLVISTMDNLGYAYTKSRLYRKALEVYNELMSAQEKADASDKTRAQTLRKLVYIQLTLRDNEGALETLREVEAIELDIHGTDSRQWKETNKLMGQVNYEVLKHPSIPSFACFTCSSDGYDEMNLFAWVPKKPRNGSKMSGHRVTYA